MLEKVLLLQVVICVSVMVYVRVELESEWLEEVAKEEECFMLLLVVLLFFDALSVLCTGGG